MIAANEIKLGNWFMHDSGWSYRNDALVPGFNFQFEDRDWSAIGECTLSLDNLHPIALTPEILMKCGFAPLPHFTVLNTMQKDIGRKRFLSFGCVGSGNEMLFLTEEEAPEVKAVIVLRNYDYDGPTYLHQLQNIHSSITGVDIAISL